MKKKVLLFLLCFLVLSVLVGGGINVYKAKAATKVDGSGKVFLNGIHSSSTELGSGRNVALDSNNYPHICVYNAYEPGYLYDFYWNGTVFVYDQIHAGGGAYCSIAINKTNNDIHVSYQESGNLKYAKKISGGTWSNESAGGGMASDGAWTSIALDTSGNPHISHQDTSNNDLVYSYHNGSSWSYSTVYDTGNVGIHSSIAVDSSNNVHIVYNDTTNARLLYATKNSSGTWTQTNRVIDTLSDDGSIVVGSDNVVKIAYRNTGGFGLGYAYGSGSTWTTSTVGSLVQPSDISLALDNSNNPHVSYRRSAALNYAYHNGSSWTLSTIDNASQNVYYTSIAYGNNNSYITYQLGSSGGVLNFVLVDNIVPSGTGFLTGKTGNVFGWNLTSSDYAQMGGGKYYCVDETNTCDPTTSLSAATATGAYTITSDFIKTLYLRMKDWSGNLVSLALVEQSERIVPKEGEKVIEDDLTYIWKKLPNNSDNYWIKTTRYKKYASNFSNASNYLLKRYWKITTNLYKYRTKSRASLIAAEARYSNCKADLGCSSVDLKKYKKQVKKYKKRMFRVRVTFYYTAKLSNNLRLKNSTLNKLTKTQAEKKLWLKVYNKSIKKWVNMSSFSLINDTKQSIDKHTFATDLKYFRQKNTLFTIGVK